MKLRDFGKKPKSTNRLTKIVVQNDSLINKYKAEIDELNTQLGHYRRIEAERDDAVGRRTAIEDTLKSERFEADKAYENLQELEKTVLNQTQLLEKIPELEEDLRTAKGLTGIKTAELDAMTKKALSQSQEISLLKPQLENLQKELEESSVETKKAISLKQSTDADFEQVSNKNKELKSFTDKTSKINKELIEENKTLRDWANYKDVENKELLVQLEEIKSIETNLREWMGQMESKNSQNSSSKNSLENEISTQQKVISDMSKTLDDIMNEMAYVRKLNRVYREELAKPTYTSMAAIASQEGFVMPNGKENIRTHNLGNYKPTLLKFKTKEVANG